MGTRDFLQRDYFEHESHEFNEYFILHTDLTELVRGGALTGFEHE